MKRSSYLSIIGDQDDSKAQVRRVPAVFPQKEFQDREAAQPGDIFIVGESQSA
jgi:hypothetical protein